MANVNVSLTSLPDEVLLSIAHTYLDPRDILHLALTGHRIHRVLLTHPGDIARTRALFGTLECVKRGWWMAAEHALRVDGWEELEWEAGELGSVASAALLELCRKNQDEVWDEAVVFASQLLAHPAVDPGARNNYAIREAVMSCHTVVVTLLLADPPVDPAVQDNYVVRDVASRGNVIMMELLLADSRVDPTTRDNYPMRISASNGHTDVVKLLLADPRVDPGAMDNFAIRLASYFNYVDVVKLLSADSRVNASVLN